MASMNAARRRRRTGLFSRFRKDLHASFDTAADFHVLAYKFYSRKQFDADLWKLAALVVVQFLVFIWLAWLDSEVVVLALIAPIITFPAFLKFHTFSFKLTITNALPALVSAYFFLVYLVAFALCMSQVYITGQMTGTLDSEILFFNTPMGPRDILHFSVVTVSTLGYGDVYPVHWLAKTICSCAAIAGVLYVAFSVAIVATLLFESNNTQRELQDLIDSVVSDSMPYIYDKHGEELTTEFGKKAYSKRYFELELLRYLSENQSFEDK